jgi:hypothetical protein
MTFAIGFGSIEQAFEDAERKAFEDYVTDRYAEMGCEYFTTELEQDVKEWLNKRAEQFQKAAESYKTSAIFPDRYSYYYPRIIGDGSDMIAKIKFHHINRRHGMSPDGWALMQSKRLFDVNAHEIERASKAA